LNRFYNNLARESILFNQTRQKMPIENLEEEGLAKNPNLQLAQWRFLLTTDTYKDDNDIKQKTLSFITENGKYILKKCTKYPRQIV